MRDNIIVIKKAKFQSQTSLVKTKNWLVSEFTEKQFKDKITPFTKGLRNEDL